MRGSKLHRGVSIMSHLIFFTGGYLITQKDVFFDRARACQLIAAMLASNDTGMKIDLSPPCIWKVCHIRIVS